MATEKTELTDNLAYGIDIKNRRIYFGVNLDTGEAEEANSFNPASVEMAVRAMHRMAAEAPNKPIELHMCSYGGDTYNMLRLHDEILASPCQIRFFGGGAIMSSGAIIMAACDERYLHINTTVMIHELNEDPGYSRHTDLKIIAEENVRLMDKINSILTANSRMPKEFWQDVSQRDLHVTASEAVSLGIADKLIEPKKRGNLRKMRYAALKKGPDAKEMRKLLGEIYGRINKVKIPRIELNEIKKESADPTIIVEENKMSEIPAVPEKYSL